MNTRDKLLSAVTAWDRKQAKRKDHNPYALGIYFQRVGEVMADIDAGTPIAKAIAAGFCDRMLSFVCKQMGVAEESRQEATWKGFPVYVPHKDR